MAKQPIERPIVDILRSLHRIADNMMSIAKGKDDSAMQSAMQFSFDIDRLGYFAIQGEEHVRLSKAVPPATDSEC